MRQDEFRQSISQGKKKKMFAWIPIALQTLWGHAEWAS